MSETKQTNETEQSKKEIKPGIVTSAHLPGYEVIGIKKAPTKDGSRIFTSYMCRKPFTDYEVDKEDIYLSGVAVEEVQTTEDFDIGIGDIVIFFYGKAIRDWQPVVDYKMIKKATPFDGKN